ncbi:MAG: hypothetical protein OES12_02955 [Anaerolineae bacterium]|jgi:hypothetical protein|nr:hypothetical protein [Anaerolineae bacterium]
MFKSGFLGAAVGFIYTMSLTLLSPLCTFCFTPPLGLAVGYVASWFDKPLRAEASLSRGTIAGALTGLGVVAGQMAATLVNGILVTNSEQLPILIREFGLSQAILTSSDEYWQATLTLNSFCSVFNFALIVGLGAVGGLIWYQRNRERPFPLVSS